MTRCLSYRMKQVKTVLLIVIVLLPVLLVSCLSGTSSVATGWAGTTIRNGIICTGTKAGTVVVMNSSTKNVEWSYSLTVTAPSGGLSCGPTSVTTALYATPVIEGDMVYVGTYGGQVLALNMLARNQSSPFPQQRYGEWEWDAPLDGGQSNAIVGDLLVAGSSIYVSDSNGRVYSLDKEFGDQNWGSGILDESYRKLWTSPVIQGDSLYVATFDGHVYSLATETGAALNWTFESSVGFASSPVISGDTIFLGSFDRHLYAIKIGADEPEWIFPQDGSVGNWFWASPVIKDGIVYAGCLDGRLYAIAIETGAEVWDFDAGDPIIASPVLLDDFLVVTSRAGNVYVFDLGAQVGGQGVPSRTIALGAAVDSSFCGQNGLVYIRDESDSLHVVDINTGQASPPISLGGV